MRARDRRSGSYGWDAVAAFEDLKRRGPQVLVIGDVPEPVSRRATRRLLGHPEEDRRRLIALTDSGVDSDDWFPSHLGTDAPDVTVVQDDRRSMDLPAEDRADGKSEWLSRAVEEEIRAWLDVGNETPRPAVLRFGLYSLATLVDAHDVRTVRRQCYRLTGAVRRARGMGHYHLPRDPADSDVADLRYIFDARLELRNDAGEAQQRWHIPGTGSTRWVRLSEEG